MAEVLITIGIIGVIAAMTLPSLMNKINEIKTVSKLKKTYSMLVNAERLSVADNGDSDGWEFNGGQYPARTFWKTYYAPYLTNNLTNFTRTQWGKYFYKFYNYTGTSGAISNFDSVTVLPDKSCLFHFANNQYYFITYDVNCSAPQNRYGKDIWDIAEFYWFQAEASGWRGVLKSDPVEELLRTQIPFMYRLRKDPSLYSGYLDQCKSQAAFRGGAPSTCFAIFVHNGWKFTKDLHW